MQKTGRTATPLEGGINFAEKAACRKSLACLHLRTIRQANSDEFYHMFAQTFLPATPTTATRRSARWERAIEIVKGEE
jgi:hypothetical protein